VSNRTNNIPRGVPLQCPKCRVAFLLPNLELPETELYPDTPPKLYEAVPVAEQIDEPNVPPIDNVAPINVVAVTTSSPF
jgi:hypothetical protein